MAPVPVTCAVARSTVAQWPPVEVVYVSSAVSEVAALTRGSFAVGGRPVTVSSATLPSSPGASRCTSWPPWLLDALTNTDRPTAPRKSAFLARTDRTSWPVAMSRSVMVPSDPTRTITSEAREAVIQDSSNDHGSDVVPS